MKNLLKKPLKFFIIFSLLVLLFIVLFIGYEKTKESSSGSSLELLCRAVWEKDIRTGPLFDSFYMDVQENYLTDFAGWKLIKKETFADSVTNCLPEVQCAVQEEPCLTEAEENCKSEEDNGLEDLNQAEHCRVISNLDFSVPQEINNLPIPIDVSVSYMTNDLILGDSNMYGPTYTDVENALNNALTTMKEDRRFAIVQNEKINEISYSSEDDYLTLSGGNCSNTEEGNERPCSEEETLPCYYIEKPCYELSYLLGGGPERGHYPRGDIGFRYSFYKEYDLNDLPEILFAKQKAEEYLVSFNEEENRSCTFSEVISGSFGSFENTSATLFSLTGQDYCECYLIAVNFNGVDENSEYVGTETNSHPGCFPRIGP